MTLVKSSQDDFSAGAYPLQAFEKVPANALSDALEALIGDDGLPYGRGGSAYQSNANTAAGRFFWSGWLGAGRRVLWTTTGNKLYTLAADFATPIELSATEGNFTRGKAAIINGMVVLPGGAIWGGSLKTAAYTVGTIDLTQNSDQVVGHGTAFLANVDAGMLLNHGRFYVVKSVEDDTHLTLAENYQGGSAVNDTYAMVVLGGAGKVAQLYVAVANRLIAMIDDTLYESQINDPQAFGIDNLIQMPAGVRILGGEAIRDQLIVFTTAGVFVVSNVALDLEDADGNPQQRLERVNTDLILASWEGIANWRNSLIVPAIDGVWIFDGLSAPLRISEGIQAQYEALFAVSTSHGGYAAVFRNHYLLPIPGEGVLVCRLLATRRGRGTTAFGWTRFDDVNFGAAVHGLGVAVQPDASSAPLLLGVDRTNGRVLSLRYLDPASPSDADGDVPVMELVTREYEVGGVHRALVRRLVARYDLVNASGVSALELAYSIDGGAWVTVTGNAPEATLADDPHVWEVNKKAHGIRFRIRSSGAATKLVLHSLELAFRPSGRAVT